MYIINALIYDLRTYIGIILYVRYVSIVILLYGLVSERGGGRELENVQRSFGGIKKKINKRKTRHDDKGGGDEKKE